MAAAIPLLRASDSSTAPVPKRHKKEGKEGLKSPLQRLTSAGIEKEE